MSNIYIPQPNATIPQPTSQVYDPTNGQASPFTAVPHPGNITPATGDPNSAGVGVAGRVNSLLDAAGSPLTALGNAVPSPIGTALGIGGDTSAPAIDPNYQRNLTTLTNKYTQMASTFSALPQNIRNAMIDLDSQRVSRGAAPLTQQQTLAAIQTATTNTPATPAAKRNPLAFFDNFRADASDVLKAIPRLPLAVVHEAEDLPNFGTRVAQAEANGANPIQAILQAPGIRMIPGTYLLGNLAGGASGVNNIISHPLLSALDALPIAHELAGSSEVAQLAAEQVEALTPGAKPRPISAVLTNRAVDAVDAAGNPIRTLERNPVGNTVDFIKKETRVGQMLDAIGGQDNRAVMRMLGGYQTRLRALLTGMGTPESDLEAFVPDARQLYARHAESTPELVDPSPAGDTFRAQLKSDIERGRNLDNYDPALIADYKGVVDRIGRYTEANDIIGSYGGEKYPLPVARDLAARDARLDAATTRQAARAEYINPSGQATADSLRDLANKALDNPLARERYRSAQAAMHAIDANGYDIDTAALKSKITAAARGDGDWSTVRQAFNDTLDNHETLHGEPPTPRRSYTDIIQQLRSVNRYDRQASRLESALAYGKRGDVTATLKNLYDRTPPAFSDEAFPGFRDDVQSMSRRQDFDNRVNGSRLDSTVDRYTTNLNNAVAKNAPARFGPLLADEFDKRAVAAATTHNEVAVGRALTPDEAGAVASAVAERRWPQAFPGLPDDERVAMLKGMERDVASTWQQLRDAGEDPIYVHNVSPARVNASETGSIGPVPIKASQGKERAFDLTPGVNDVQVALTHQATELLAEHYREQFADQMTGAFAKTEAQLREELAPTVRWRMTLNPSLDFEGHLQEAIRRAYDKFNPDEAGHSWGGVKLDKYRNDDFYIPKSIASNLKRLATPPGLFSSAIDPFTKLFRYNVIGLSAGVIVNNFISHGVMVAAEDGLGPFKYLDQAREWMRDPASIPNEDLKTMMLAEHPEMETINRDAWLKSKNGQRYLISSNAGRAFNDSAVAEGLRTGKNALDSIAEKSLKLQSMGQNIYRAAVYLNDLNKNLDRGLTQEAAEAAAVEHVQRVLIDYNSFTPIERSAIRTIIPFYGYMGHAMRFISRFPLDHPLRASLVAKLAEAEKERLGSLPESFLGMIPLGKADSHGHQRFLPLAPFDAFGDISNMYSVAGWLAATNPVLQATLESVGITRGQSDPYPNLRYDPQTGRMMPVHSSFLGSLFEHTLPRAGLVTAALGVNDTYNQLRGSDSGAAGRYLLSAAGLPRLWQTQNPIQSEVRAEVARQSAADLVKNSAYKSGDWSEALRYPSLQTYFDQLRQTSPSVLALNTPATQSAIADQLRTLIGAN